MICASLCLLLLIRFPFRSSEIVLDLRRFEGVTSTAFDYKPRSLGDNLAIRGFDEDNKNAFRRLSVNLSGVVGLLSKDL
jgi:hypothetical protein